MKGLGIYLQVLREAAGLSRARVAADLGTTENTLWRIESGRQEPASTMLAGIVRAVGGDWPDVEALLLDGDADEATARRLAARRLSGATEADDDPEWAASMNRLRAIERSRDQAALQFVLDMWETARRTFGRDVPHKRHPSG